MALLILYIFLIVLLLIDFKLFFKEIRVKDKKIVNIIYQPVIDVLTQANRVILSTSFLDKHSYTTGTKKDNGLQKNYIIK